MKKDLIYLTTITALFILLLSKCKPTPPKAITKTVTETIIKSDTVIKYIDVITSNHIYHTDTIIKVVNDTISVPYHIQTFNDTLYTLKTYSEGIVDSININIRNKELLIRDSIFINITTTNTIYNNYNNIISLGGLHTLNHNSVRVDYDRYFGRIGVGGSLGYEFNNKVPVMGVKVGIRW